MPRLSKNYSKREKLEGRCWIAEYYPDGEGFQPDVLERLSVHWERWYYVLHDKDCFSESDYDKYLLAHNGLNPDWSIGDLKKPHYHLIGYSSSPCVLGRAAERFGCPSYLVQKVKRQKESIQYLIHLNNPEKYQYQPEEVITNDPEILSKLKRSIDASEKASLLLSAIFDGSCTTLTSLAQFAISEGLWDELRRGQHIYTSLISEQRAYRKESEFYDVSVQGFKEFHSDDS